MIHANFCKLLHVNCQKMSSESDKDIVFNSGVDEDKEDNSISDFKRGEKKKDDSDSDSDSNFSEISDVSLDNDKTSTTNEPNNRESRFSKDGFDTLFEKVFEKKKKDPDFLKQDNFEILRQVIEDNDFNFAYKEKPE